MYGGIINDVRMTGKHLPYLVLQCGDISDLRHDKHAWAAVYRQRLHEDFRTVRHALPGRCRRFLDVGSGLGGVDIIIKRHYEWGRGGAEAWLLDGKDDVIDPDLEAVEDHDETFNSEVITRDFWNVNDEKLGGYISPSGLLREELPRSYDLVLSLRSWCFHYEPKRYLQWVAERTFSGATLIVDKRIGKVNWMHQLEEHFKLIEVLRTGAKAERIWLVRR